MFSLCCTTVPYDTKVHRVNKQAGVCILLFGTHCYYLGHDFYFLKINVKEDWPFLLSDSGVSDSPAGGLPPLQAMYCSGTPKCLQCTML